MNRVPIVLPELGTEEVVFSLWHVTVGDKVAVGERLAEVLIPGIAVELQAEVSGVLKEVTARPGEKLALNTILGTIEIFQL